MHRWLRPFWIFLALVFLLEAWLWDHLEPLVARVVNVVPWGKVKAWLARAIDRLPPWATLIVFVVPVALLFPIKLLGLWLLARGYWLSAIGTLLLAKLVGLGVTAFVFDVTRDKLLQMDWFRRMYDWFMWARSWAHAQVEPIRQRLRKIGWLMQPRRAGRFLRRLMRIRRRAHQSRAAA